MNASHDISRLNFLIVEDESFQREALAMLLSGLGAKHILQAENGREALTSIRRGSILIDIILCDLEMPEMDGMAFLRHLGEMDHKPSVILVSGLDSAMMESVDTMGKAYGINVLGTMPKPASRSRLLGLITKHADSAAKQRTIYDGQFPKHELAAALQHGEFLPFFQPKVEIATGRVVGMEALARWKSPSRGLLMPGAFLASIDTHGLMDSLTWIILARSAAICRNWLDQGLPLTVSVNLSLSSLGRLGLAERIYEVVTKQDIAPSSIILEVTETAAMADIGPSLENLTRLRMKGFGLSIDDYGTGYSSMQQLTRVPFTELKIDQSFVRDAEQRESMRAVVESSLEIAKKLGLHATAEGVETHEHWEMLEKMGCEIAQGYLIAKPMEAAAIPDWVASWARTSFVQVPHHKPLTVNILLVEDEDFQRDIYGEILEKMGLGQVHVAQDVEMALQFLNEYTYDLVITDIELGGRTGLDLVKLIRTRQTPASEATRVILLTSHGEQDVVFSAISLDINGFLKKPATPRALQEAIQLALAEEFKPQSPIVYQALIDQQDTGSRMSASIMRSEDTTSPGAHAAGGERVSLFSLKAGMVLAETLYTRDGIMVLSKKHVLTPSIINRLMDISGSLKSLDVLVIPPETTQTDSSGQKD